MSMPNELDFNTAGEQRAALDVIPANTIVTAADEHQPRRRRSPTVG